MPATWTHRVLFLAVLFKCALHSQSWSNINDNGNIVLLPSQQHQQHHSLLSSSSCPVPNPNLYYRPVIGILSHPGDGASGRLTNASGVSNIPASYVKFVEAGEARVIPLIYNESPEKLLKKLDLVNGVIFTGGWAKGGLYLETVRKVFKKVLEKNDAGDHFPLYGIRLGFELITMIVSEDNNILVEFSASNQASTLHFVENASIEGSIFQSFPPDLLKKLSTDCIVMQNHRFGISPERVLENKKLTSFYEILTTCKDEDDKVYVSTTHSRNYPATAFQWHTEKNAFEWGSAKIPHTQDAIRVTHSAANFLVSEARKSSPVRLGNPQTDLMLKKCETISFKITVLLLAGRLGKDMMKFISSHKNTGRGHWMLFWALCTIMIVCSRNNNVMHNDMFCYISRNKYPSLQILHLLEFQLLTLFWPTSPLGFGGLNILPMR